MSEGVSEEGVASGGGEDVYARGDGRWDQISVREEYIA